MGGLFGKNYDGISTSELQQRLATCRKRLYDLRGTMFLAVPAPGTQERWLQEKADLESDRRDLEAEILRRQIE